MTGEQGKSGRRARHDPTTIVFLSIFLLLLGFFILLNAISEENQLRADLVAGSVAATFRSQRETPSERPSAGTQAGIFKSAVDFQGALEGLFEQTFMVRSQSDLPPGAVLQVALPPLRIFRNQRADFHSRSGPLLAAIADLLTRPAIGRVYELELVIGGDVRTGDRPGDRRGQLRIARLGSFAARMRALGVPANAIRIGLDAKPGNALHLTFFDRDAEKARQSFSPRLDRIP